MPRPCLPCPHEDQDHKSTATGRHTLSIQVKITGHLVADPQVQFTNAEKTVAHFTVMNTARRKDDETGEWVDGHTTAIRVTAWEDLDQLDRSPWYQSWCETR